MIIVDSEFQSICPKLTDEQYSTLEASLLTEGCRDAVVVWDNLLLDGHNRYAICEKHGIEYTTNPVDLPDRNAAINWIIDNQLGRRNLTPEQASYLRGKRYRAEKKSVPNPEGRNQHQEVSCQNDNQPKTDETLATQTGVSPRTIHRDAKFSEAVDAVSDSLGEEAKQAILQGKARTSEGGKASRSAIVSTADRLDGSIEMTDGEVVITETPKVAPTDTSNKPHDLAILHSSESNEWYTPPEYIYAVHQVMGGIDLDPASTETANQTVNADRYFTIENDGLAQSWSGRVFLNPPYGKDDKGQSNQQLWTEKLINHYRDGSVTEAVLLVNAATASKWFQPLFGHPICFTNHRIRFLRSDGERGDQPPHGQAFVYFGQSPNRFRQVFHRLGAVVQLFKTTKLESPYPVQINLKLEIDND